MPLNHRVKEVTLKVTLHHILRNAQKSIERTCRNVLALGKDLSSETFSADTLNEFQHELKVLLQDGDETKIREWLALKFHL